jgi:hypothetical protein
MPSRPIKFVTRPPEEYSAETSRLIKALLETSMNGRAIEIPIDGSVFRTQNRYRMRLRLLGYRFRYRTNGRSPMAKSITAWTVKNADSLEANRRGGSARAVGSTHP